MTSPGANATILVPPSFAPLQMNRFFTLSSAVLSLAIVGCANTNPSPTGSAYSSNPAALKTLRVRTTAYTGTRNAISKPLSHGPVTSAASDWSEFPIGTRFRIRQTGKTYIIDDYGSALVGTRTIDLAKRNNTGISQWGVRWVDIDILEWGSSRRSLEILTPREKVRYVKPMVAALRKQSNGIPKAFHRVDL